MKRSLILTEALRDFIRHLPPDLKRKVKQALIDIVNDSSSGKALGEDLSGLRSYRIGKIRVVYRRESTATTLIAIGPRKTIYQQVSLEIKRRVEGSS